MEKDIRCHSSMVVDHTVRITSLEASTEAHSKRIKNAEDMLQEVTHMKYAVYGAVSLYLMQTIGLSEVLKRIFL